MRAAARRRAASMMSWMWSGTAARRAARRGTGEGGPACCGPWQAKVAYFALELPSPCSTLSPVLFASFASTHIRGPPLYSSLCYPLAGFALPPWHGRPANDATLNAHTCRVALL
ncbi:MAG: hypothetical protein J3K34DRAFT_424240 [Monoraphidium minutum]|nr:MAG: hypothetical protein J3K34DRAFT_424240 [Monoraphidium minutum]